MGTFWIRGKAGSVSHSDLLPGSWLLAPFYCPNFTSILYQSLFLPLCSHPGSELYPAAPPHTSCLPPPRPPQQLGFLALPDKLTYTNPEGLR